MQIGKLVLKKVEPATKDEKLKWEKELLGMYVSAHPLDNYKNVLSHLSPIRKLKSVSDGTIVTVGGIISKLRRTLTKKNDPMAFMTLEDPTGSAEVLVFPKVMEKALPFLELEKVVQITGRLSIEEESFTIIADELKELPSDETYGLALSEMQKNSRLVIFMDSLADMAILNQVKDILAAHTGNAQVYLQVGAGPNAKKIKTQSQVSISPALVDELRLIKQISKVDAS